jgi:hypothetical protein
MSEGSMQTRSAAIDVSAVIVSAIHFRPHDFPRHTAAVVEEEGVIYPHVWEMASIQGIEPLFAMDDGRLFVRKADAAVDPRGAAIILREVNADEADEILETPEISHFIAKYMALLNLKS